MIKTEKGITEIEGGLVEIMADTALVLANLYVISKDKLGKASAREMIVEAWMPVTEPYERRENSD